MAKKSSFSDIDWISTITAWCGITMIVASVFTLEWIHFGVGVALLVFVNGIKRVGVKS